MVTITSIEPQKNGKRLNIYLDGNFGFGIDLESFVKLGLKINQNLTDLEVQEIIRKAEFQKTLGYLLKFATLRLRSEKEIKDWLKKKKVSETLHLDLFNRLKRLELVDDEAFTKWWVDQRLQFKYKSKRELEYELKMKGIKKEIIGKVLEGEKIDEEKIIRNLIEKKRYKWEKLAKQDKHKARQKMGQYLTQKGFSWEVIDRVLEEL